MRSREIGEAERRLTAAYDLDLGDIARTIVPYVRVANGKPELTFDPASPVMPYSKRP